MEEIKINSIEELESCFSRYGDGYLYRGQTKHYLDAENRISISPSFNRQGCIPPLMFKWAHYSKSLIRVFGGENYHEIGTGLSQAILQHYGWRSFYVDLSKSPHVACWFAANQYQDKRTTHMCEDFEESPVWLVHKEASYVESTGSGHLYIFDTEALKTSGVEVHDLTELQGEGRLRFNTQEACLAGGSRSGLPQASIVAHLEVDCQFLVDFYKKKSIDNVLDIFPDRENDFILNSLLEIPWHKVSTNREFPIPIFKRGLEIPEYDVNFTKHLNPNVTLFSGFWISENRFCPDSQFCKIPFYKLPETAYYAGTNEEFDLSEVTKILEKYDGFIVELDALIHIPELRSEYEHEKGVYVERIESDIVSVNGLVIEHPGHKVAGIGANRGWCYKIEGGQWRKVDHEDQCPCNNDLRHELQFSVLRALNESLKNGEFTKEDDLSYSHKDINYA